MNIGLEPTGERLIEDAYADSVGAYVIYLMHAASYSHVESLCRGQRVLDLGCGSGYGAHRIAGVASSVVGGDVATDAIAFARRRYQADNLTFQTIPQAGPLPFDDACFDVVLSFQVIEHVEDVDRYLGEAHRVLRPGGTLVVITPDRRHRLLPRQKPWNRWHLKEYSRQELEHVVARRFEVQKSLRMGAPDSVAQHEIRRYRLLKWATLPVTLPFVPESLRRLGLNAMHSLRPKRAAVAADSQSAREVDYGFGQEAFEISEDPPNSLNLVLTARKK